MGRGNLRIWLRLAGIALLASLASACSDEQHEAMARGDFKLPGKIKFLG